MPDTVVMPIANFVEIGMCESRPFAAPKNSIRVFFAEHNFDSAALVSQQLRGIWLLQKCGIIE